jgi:hypothetical protein
MRFYFDLKEWLKFSELMHAPKSDSMNHFTFFTFVQFRFDLLSIFLNFWGRKNSRDFFINHNEFFFKWLKFSELMHAPKSDSMNHFTFFTFVQFRFDLLSIFLNFWGRKSSRDFFINHNEFFFKWLPLLENPRVAMIWEKKLINYI